MIDDIRDLLAALNQAEVRFLIVGAHALAAHGVPRVTGDVDIWVESSEPNARRVWEALGLFGAPLDALSLRIEDFSEEGQVIQLGLPPYRADFLTSITGVTFSEAWPDRLEGDLLGVRVAFISEQHLILNKTATGRQKDLSDVRALKGRTP